MVNVLVAVWLRSQPIRAAWIEILKERRDFLRDKSQPIRAAWIEIWEQIVIKKAVQSQPIRAAWIEIRIVFVHYKFVNVSQPIRAAWIEIGCRSVILLRRPQGRSPFGLRGLKYKCNAPRTSPLRRSPFGLRGLKF